MRDLGPAPLEEWVTQLCSMRASRSPQNQPRARDSDGVSAILGQLSVSQAVACVRFSSPVPVRTDGVRYAKVAALVDAGFDVRLTPSKRIPGHVSIRYPGEWDDEVSGTFHACFTDVHNGGEEDEQHAEA